jgi:Tol biopolymer transport system component/DNA-binding winged helix-turn-helix (wHTH) protein
MLNSSLSKGRMTVVSDNGSRIVRFSVFEVDLRAGELRRNGAKVRLQEQPFQILVSLLERPGEIVTREELRGRLWPSDTFVDFDHSLNAAVRRLRDALGDSAEAPRFVETVARRGYRFVAPVNGALKETPAEPVKTSRSSAAWRWLAAVAAVVLMIGGTLGWFLGRRSVSPQTPRQTRLTANTSEMPVLGGVISPDGKYLAFADASGFYLRQIQSGETHLLQLPKGFDAQPESWYPDSSHLVATWVAGLNEPPSLWELSVMGGTPRKLADEGYTAAVSPDGSQVAFLRGPSLQPELWLMVADGSKPRKLLAAGEGSLGQIAWSPDGNWIVYPRDRYKPSGEETQIEGYDLRDGRRQVVISQAGLCRGVAWSRDGRLIYSLREEPPNQDDSNLWSVEITSQAARPTGLPKRISTDPGYTGLVSITRDGKRLAFSKFFWQPDVYVANLESHGERLSKPQRFTFDEREDLPYTWTPDSKEVVFVSNRNGNYQIYKQRIGESAPELLIRGPEQLTIPRLSPDGSMVLYLVNARSGGPATSIRLMSAPLLGGPPRLVLEAAGINNHQCSRLPANVCLFSTIIEHELRFYRYDPANGNSKELSLNIRDSDPYAFNWTLSPDGTTLAMSTKLGSQKEPVLRLISIGNGRERTFKVGAWSGVASLDWAADGKSIWATAYTARNDWTLLNLDLKGRVRVMLKDKLMRIGWAIPSPDGRRLALWESSGTSNVWMVENF